MTNFIPIFPLGIVVYPGEQLNLHIFEPRYKQLITECAVSKKPFGIPAVIDGKVQDIGTLVKVVEIIKQYEDGKMDIITEGLEVFSVLEVIKELPDKLYSGAIVNYPLNNTSGNRSLMFTIIAAIRELHKLLNISKAFKEDGFALHHRFGGKRADIAETKHGGAVGNHGHEVGARRQRRRFRGVVGDLGAGGSHAGGIGQRQVTLVGKRFGRLNLKLSRPRQPVVGQCRGMEFIRIGRHARFPPRTSSTPTRNIGALSQFCGRLSRM